MKIITICGSLKYINKMMEIAEKLELEGDCVLTPIFNSSRKNKDDFTEEELEMLAKGHKEKIKLSDAIYVINVNNYIGKSTASEIEYAKSLNKEIIYLEDTIKEEN